MSLRVILKSCSMGIIKSAYLIKNDEYIDILGIFHGALEIESYL
jgi:hypothetical protein